MKQKCKYEYHLLPFQNSCILSGNQCNFRRHNSSVLVMGSGVEITGQIFAIKRYAIHDGPGIRTTVFLKGCPLNCWWCHNPEGRSNSISSDGQSYTITPAKVLATIIKDSIFYDESGGGVTFSGGEPLAQIDFLAELLKSCRDHGFHTAIDTCGYAEYEAFERIVQYVNLFLYDLKIINQDEHTRQVGKPNDVILENLKRLVLAGHQVRIRIPLIPGITDSVANLTQIAEFVSELGHIRFIDLLPYNQLGVSKYNRMGLGSEGNVLTAQTSAEIEERRSLLETYGFEVGIGGGR